jgi:hypothetical protein
MDQAPRTRGSLGANLGQMNAIIPSTGATETGGIARPIVGEGPAFPPIALKSDSGG